MMHKKPLEKIRITFQLADHCNLNCKGCLNLSSIAKPTFPCLEDCTRDMIRMKELFGSDIDQIRMLGGEPLLNPDIISFIRVAREIFPDTPIVILTNGILLLKMEEAFWAACHDYNAEISITRYPITIDYDAIFRKGEEVSVNVYFYPETRQGPRDNLHHLSLDPRGTHDAEYAFMNCAFSNTCTMIQNGHAYTCVVVPVVHHFNRHFGLDLQVDAADSINIHTAQSGEEILDFLSRPIPFCRYCNVDARQWNAVPWGGAQKRIEEWVTDVSLDQGCRNDSCWKKMLSFLKSRL